MRLLLTTLTLLCALAVVARPAGADTTIATTGSQLTITAAPGVANTVTIGPGASPGMVLVSDAADTVADDGSCAPAGAAMACTVTGTISVVLGDGDDRLSAAASPVPLTVDAGSGNDTVDVANAQADTVTCGDGADDASGADAQDALAADCEETPATAGPPHTRIDSGPPALTSLTSASFAFGASEPATFQCSFDAVTFAPCDPTPTFPGLTDGDHALFVRAVDLVGNPDPTPAEYRWTQDSVRPQTQLIGGPASSIPVNSASATFSFASPDGASFECSLDAGGWQACASPVTYGGLADGTHTFAVRAVDAAGNVDGTPATRAWNVRVDGAPVARIAVARDGDGFTLDAAASTEPDGSPLVYRWQRNGAAAGTGATLHYAAPDHASRDALTVTVTDAGGQRAQATVAMRTRATTQTSALQRMDVVRFSAGTRLAPGASARIAALRSAISAGAAQVRIEGFSRAAGDARAVSGARARAVRALLVKGAGRTPAVTIAARGAAGPAASNATAAGRARNDRVVVTVSYQGPAPRLVTEQEGDAAISRSNAPQAAAAGSGRAPRLFAFWSNVPGGLRRLEEVGSRVDVLAPNWYTLSPADATIRGGRPNARVTKLSRALGFAVWPVVNATMGGSALIDTPAGRGRVVARIGALAARYRLAGVTLDMEEMLPRQRASYSTLVAQLAAALHAKHRRLAIYAVRRTATDVDDVAAAYDWTVLARAADLVLASGYNEHSATTAPGPVATQAGFAALASYAAATSRARVAPTMGAFGYQWTGGAARMISSADAERRWPVAAEVGSADGRSALAGATQTWFASAEDLWAQEQAARRAGAQWIGLFSLGREPERFWERSILR